MAAEETYPVLPPFVLYPYHCENKKQLSTCRQITPQLLISPVERVIFQAFPIAHFQQNKNKVGRKGSLGNVRNMRFTAAPGLKLASALTFECGCVAPLVVEADCAIFSLQTAKGDANFHQRLLTFSPNGDHLSCDVTELIQRSRPTPL
jgi:hypothetical protein